MKLSTVTRILKENLAAASELPKFIDPLLTPLNQFIEQVVSAVNGKLTFQDNFQCKLFTISASQGEEVPLNQQSKFAVTGMLPLSCDAGYIIDGYGYTLQSDGTIKVQLRFIHGATGLAPAATVKISCKLVLFLG